MGKEKERLKKFEEEFNKNVKPKKVPLIESLIAGIPKSVPEDMRLLAGVVGLGKLASLLRIVGVKENTGEIIPCSVYGIAMVLSGMGKDRSIKTVDRLLEPSYKAIYNKISLEEEERARNQALIELGVEKGGKETNAYKKYLKRIPSFTGTTGTPEGVCRGLYNFSKYSLGSKFFIETEFASALKTSGTIAQSMKVLAEGFDSGYFEAKTISNEESAIPQISNMNTSMLLFSDPYTILTDNATKSKYREEMTQRYARRSFFVYIPDDKEEVSLPDFKSFMESSSNDSEKEKEYTELFKKFSSRIRDGKFKQKVIIPTDTWRYLEYIVTYYTIIKNSIPERNQILRKSYQDVPWRGFKLAIGIAGIYNSDVLTMEHINQGLYYSQKLFKSIEEFEEDISLESFERFARYINNNTVSEDELEVKLSEMVKLGFITAKANKSNINDLVTMTRTQLPRHTLEYDSKLGIVKAKAFRKDGELGVSIVTFPSGTEKSERVNRSKKGYKYVTCEFNDLRKVLSNDCAFVPFKLKDGTLLKDNVISGTKFLIFDVDDSEETYEEAGDMLEDFTYHIATTSNSDNPYKYRILIELDGILDLERDVWVKTMESVANHIGIKSNIDKLHKTQTTFGYKDSKVISNNGEALNTKVVMDIATMHKENLKKKAESRNSSKKRLDNDIKKNYIDESEQFVALMLNGAGRNLSLHNAYKYFADYTNDLDFIADTIIPYIHSKFIEYGGKPIDDHKFKRLQDQIKRGG